MSAGVSGFSRAPTPPSLRELRRRVPHYRGPDHTKTDPHGIPRSRLAARTRAAAQMTVQVKGMCFTAWLNSFQRGEVRACGSAVVPSA